MNNAQPLLFSVLILKASLAFATVSGNPYPNDQSDRCAEIMVSSFSSKVQIFGQPLTDGLVLYRPLNVQPMLVWAGYPLKQRAVKFADWHTRFTAAVSPDGGTVALGTEAGQIQISKIPDNIILQNFIPVGLNPESPKIRALAFSPDGKRLAIFSYNSNGWLYNRNAQGEWKLEKAFETGERLIHETTFSPDGRWLTFNTRCGTHFLYDLNFPEKAPRALVMPPDKRLVDRTKHSGGSVFSWDSRYLIMGTSRTERGPSTLTQVWDTQEKKWTGFMQSGEKASQRYIDQVELAEVANLPDNPPSFGAVHPLRGRPEIVFFQNDLPNELPIFDILQRPERLTTFSWNYLTGEKVELRYSEMFDDRFAQITAFASSHDGKFLLMGDVIGALRVYDAETKVELFSTQAFPYEFSPSPSGMLGVPGTNFELTGIAHLWMLEGDLVLVQSLDGQLRHFKLSDLIQTAHR